MAGNSVDGLPGQPADFMVWDQIPTLTALQAAWLWFEREPQAWSIATPERVKALADVIADAVGVYPPDPVAQYRAHGRRDRASRDELKAYALQQGHKPAFLFPENRLDASLPVQRMAKVAATLEPAQSTKAAGGLLSPVTLKNLEEFNRAMAAGEYRQFAPRTEPVPPPPIPDMPANSGSVESPQDRRKRYAQSSRRSRDWALAYLERVMEKYSPDRRMPTPVSLAPESLTLPETQSDRSDFTTQLAKTVPTPPNPSPEPKPEPFRFHLEREKDQWGPAIRAAARRLYEEQGGRMPDATQVWQRLNHVPPHGYMIKPERGMLTMPGENPMDLPAFKKRWANYTRKTS